MRHGAVTFGCSVILVSRLAIAQQHSMPVDKETTTDGDHHECHVGCAGSSRKGRYNYRGEAGRENSVASPGRQPIYLHGRSHPYAGSRPDVRSKRYGVDRGLARQKEPPKNKVGFCSCSPGALMRATLILLRRKPEANNNWVDTGPHVMIVGAKGLLDAYPRSPKPDTSVPYVMWADTPYEHLMIPVR